MAFRFNISSKRINIYMLKYKNNWVSLKSQNQMVFDYFANWTIDLLTVTGCFHTIAGHPVGCYHFAVISVIKSFIKY